ncbi:MAG: MFS transporter [Thermoanaerobaculia bacterium]
MRARRAASLAGALFALGFGQELWWRYLPAYLRALGASAFSVGLFGTLRDLLDAAYAYPGGLASDRLGTRHSLLLFSALTTAGYVVYALVGSVTAVFAGLLLVMAWPSLGLPSTFAVIGEELEGPGRIRGFTAQAVVKRLPILVAPPLGGLLLERYGMESGMRLGFGLSIAIAVPTLLFLSRAMRQNVPGAVVSPSRGDRSKPRLHPALRQLLVADCLVRLCEGLPDVFLVVWALEVVRISPLQFGVLTSILMGTAILSYAPAAALAGRVEKKPFVLLTYAFFTAFPVAVVLASSFPALAIAYGIGGLREIGEPARKALILDLADPAARGRTVGLYYGIRGFSVAGAAAVGGALWTLSPALTFIVAAALGLAGTAWAAAFLPSTSRRQEVLR